jgi:hypothetical protein
VRLGKQVVSWGESTFIGNSINSINPIDVSAFRRPGAELKEGLIPVNMFYVSQSLSDNLSAEAFYQLEWDQTVVDNCGTFFAQPDVIADGCDQNLAVLTNDPTSIGAINSIFGPAGLGVTASPFNEGIVVRRGADRDADDDGQFGLALRYFAEELDTEFGAYYMNYHSRLPVFSGSGASVTAQNQINAISSSLIPLVGAATAARLAAAATAGNSSYFIEYPEDIHLFGLSFSTTLPTGTAWSGEVSYRPNAPVQLNTTDILFSGLNPIVLGGAVRPFDNASVLNGQDGEDMHGYRRKELTQFQTTFTHFFDQVMGASRLTLVGEIGVVHTGGLESTSKARYGRDPVFGPGPLPGGLCQALNASTLGNPNAENVSKYCEDDGFVTSTAWGYRARAIWDYNDVFAGINLKPSVAWSHDVDGYGPNGLFTEDAKAISLGLDAEYQNTYTASLAYTDFFGGQYNTSIDRDFLAFSVGVNF